MLRLLRSVEINKVSEMSKFLIRHLRIEVSMLSEVSLVGDFTKWNVACERIPRWNGSEVLIK